MSLYRCPVPVPPRQNKTSQEEFYISILLKVIILAEFQQT